MLQVIKISTGLFLAACSTAMAFSSGPPAMRAGISGEAGGATCADCHRGTEVNGDTRGRLTIAAANYRPGVSQTIKVILEHPEALRWGFELTVRTAGNPLQGVGTFTAVSGSIRVVCSTGVPQPCPSGQSEFATHLVTSTYAGQSNRAEWNIEWTPPADASGDLTIYAAGNAANFSGTNTGDRIYTTNVMIGATTGLRFVPVAPCRLADTREPGLGAFGAPALVAGSPRTFTIPNANCGIPANAAAYSLNATVVPKEPLGFITIWPTGTAQPFVSTLNAVDGRIKANAAIVPAGNLGAINVFANNATELILDINGYFIDPAANEQALAYYPLTPCRVVDTRNANGALGGPVIAAGASRSFPVLSSNCGVPAGALAYSLNATVVPSGPLGFLTLWPTGQPQPFVSTLNALTGAIVANAAIVPVGTNGSVSAFVSGQSHLVLDINGYFAAPGAANAQRFFTATPCRVLDTRNAAGEFGGPVLAASQPRSYRLPLATCNLPQTAAAYSLNATVVPAASLGFLTLWPAGAAQPFVSALNAPDDPIVANAAIVPAGTGGGVSSYVTDQTHLILDTNGYFAP